MQSPMLPKKDLAISRLIEARKISFPEIHKLKPHHLKLLGNSHYLNSITKSKDLILWNYISALNEEFCQFLLEDETINFVQKERLTLNSISTTSSGHVLEHKYGMELTEKYIAEDLSFSTLDSLKKLNKMFIAETHAKRLFALYKNSSSTINGELDTKENVIYSITCLAQQQKFSTDEIKELTYKNFLLKLKRDFQKPARIHPLYSKCRQEIKTAEHAAEHAKALQISNQNFWEETSNKIMEMVKDPIHTSSTPISRKNNSTSFYGAKDAARHVLERAHSSYKEIRTVFTKRRTPATSA